MSDREGYVTVAWQVTASGEAWWVSLCVHVPVGQAEDKRVCRWLPSWSEAKPFVFIRRLVF